MSSDAGKGMEDMDLLAAYAENGCQESFAALVARHVHWVHAMSLRGVRDRHMADDVAQAVFIILARKAKAIPRQTILRGWLFKTTRFAVADALKKRNRHRKHEERAAELVPPKQSTPDEQRVWAEMSPQLDEAVACLSDNDRLAVTLRFYEGKSLAEVGRILGISEEAAKKRVARAIDRLRLFFSREAVGGATAALLLGLVARNVQATVAPTAHTFAAGALGLKAPSGMALSYANGACRAMLEAIGRLWAAIAASALGLGMLFWILSGVTSNSTGPSATVIAEDHPTQVPYDRFAKVWLSTDAEVVWEYPPASGQDLQRQQARLEVLQGRPLYAVARDHQGELWIKQVQPRQLVGTLFDESLVALPYNPSGKIRLPRNDQILAALLHDAPPPTPAKRPAIAPEPAPAFANAPWKPNQRPTPGRESASPVDVARRQSPKAEIEITPKQPVPEDNQTIVTPEWRRAAGSLQLQTEGGSIIDINRDTFDPMDWNYQKSLLQLNDSLYVDGMVTGGAFTAASADVSAILSGGVGATISIPHADATRVPEPGLVGGLLGAAMLMLRRKRK